MQTQGWHGAERAESTAVIPAADVPNSWRSTQLPAASWPVCPPSARNPKGAHFLHLSWSHPAAATPVGFMELPLRGRNTDSHESLSLSPAGRMTMKMDILEGFSLALLTLNAYSIITKGKKKKGCFQGKKVQPKHKNTSRNPNKLHTFLQIIYGGIGCSAQTSYRDQVVDVQKGGSCPEA